MNGHGKSDSPVVPAKLPNKDGLEPSTSYGETQTGTKGETPDTAKGEPKASERGESSLRRGWREGGRPKGMREQNMPRTQDRVGVPSARDRIRQAARTDKKGRFTTLLHHVYNIETLREAYFGLKREAAPGVDGETWREYGEQLEENLVDLSERLKTRGVPSEARPASATFRSRTGDSGHSG